MNYLVLIIVAIVGIAFGMYFARRKANMGFIEKQMEQKAESKQKIIAFVQEHEQIKNDDVEKLAGMSNATAERYLDELEKEGKLTQHGTTGQSVFYTLK